jgi:hypothetical protein
MNRKEVKIAFNKAEAGITVGGYTTAPDAYREGFSCGARSSERPWKGLSCMKPKFRC